jgi:hypothetical protein
MTPNNALILAVIVGAIYIMVLFDRIKRLENRFEKQMSVSPYVDMAARMAYRAAHRCSRRPPADPYLAMCR